MVAGTESMAATVASTDDFLRDIDERYALPSASPIVASLIRIAGDDEEVSLAEIAELIAKDPSLTTRILKLANSPFFRSRNPVTTPLQAVARIGVRHTRLFALSVSLKETFSLKEARDVEYSRFWRLSLYQGLLARWLAKRLRSGDAEEAFVAGFTREIGFVILLRTFGRDHELTLQFPVLPLLEEERNLYGVDHRQIGGALLRSWGLPDRIVSCQQSFVSTEDLLYLPEPVRTCIMAEELSAFICGRQNIPHDLLDVLQDLFGLDKNTLIDALTGVLGEVDEAGKAFGVDVHGTADTIELIQKANHALARLAKESLDLSPSDNLPAFETLPGPNQIPDTIKMTLEAVAHEIRNPLTAMGGLVRRLAKTIDPESREALYVQRIITETERLEEALHGMKRLLG
jgi:HD-like signal output (HDOD) protein